jgi:hypothetical protein
MIRNFLTAIWFAILREEAKEYRIFSKQLWTISKRY